MTTFNGAAATIFNNERPVLRRGADPDRRPGCGGLLRRRSALFPNGVTLTVTPVVSADRRYVRMTLTPFFNALNGFTTIHVPGGRRRQRSGRWCGGDQRTIQLPNTTTTTVTTTVTVPDGGTVLLGGVKRLNEERTEFGVPVLSKMPLIDRLFRNVGIGRITTSLMLMVTPRIIILEEEEERLGIPSVAF